MALTLATRLETFREHLFATPTAVDQYGEHSQFVSGMHGVKIDFDGIPTASELFQEWVDISARGLVEFLREKGIVRLGLSALTGVVLLGVANGTNRVVEPVAKEVGFGLVPLETYKSSPKTVDLQPDVAAMLAGLDPQLVVPYENVATRGTTSASAVRALRGILRADDPWIEVLNCTQRRPELEELAALGVVYSSLIEIDILPTYTAEQCRSYGYCADGWQLKEHARSLNAAIQV